MFSSTATAAVNPFFHVVAHVAVRGIFDQQTGTWAEPQFAACRLHSRTPATDHPPCGSRLPARRGAALICCSAARAGDRVLDRSPASRSRLPVGRFSGPRDLFQFGSIALASGARNDLLGQRVLRIKRFQLPQQAFTQIRAAHADRVEVLHTRPARRPGQPANTFRF